MNLLGILIFLIGSGRGEVTYDSISATGGCSFSFLNNTPDTVRNIQGLVR